MHPVIAQAIAAERARDLQAYVVEAGRAREARRAPRTRLFTHIPGAVRAPMSLAAARPLRGPRPA